MSKITVIILLVLSVLSTLLFLMITLSIPSVQYTEANTIELTATLSHIEEVKDGDHKAFIVHTFEYGSKLRVPSEDELLYIDYFVNMHKGQIIIFRVDNFSLESFEKSNTAVIVALKTSEKEIMTLEISTKWRRSFEIRFREIGVFTTIISSAVAVGSTIYLWIVNKKQKSFYESHRAI